MKTQPSIIFCAIILRVCTRVSYDFDLTLLVVQRPGPPPGRPQLTPPPDQRQQHDDLFEGEASVPEGDTDPTTTNRQQVRLIIPSMHPVYCLRHLGGAEIIVSIVYVCIFYLFHF